MIEGVKITPLKKIDDDRGSVLHMMRKDSAIFKSFGEIYFSVAFPGKIKAWHLHKETFLNYACIDGTIKLVLFDDRKESKTLGKIQEIFISNENHKLITIPPMIWNGFCSANKDVAVLANCPDIPHDKSEIIRLNYNDPKFPYDWKK